MANKQDVYGDLDRISEGLDDSSPRRTKGRKHGGQASGMPVAKKLQEEVNEPLVTKLAELERKTAALEAEVGIVEKWLPVSQRFVKGRILELDPNKLVHFGSNARNPDYFDEASTADLMPLLKRDKQTTEAIVRVTESGAQEIIDGSRRRYCQAVLGNTLRSWVALEPISDADALAMVVNSDAQKNLSAREYGEFFGRKIDSGEYKSWIEIGRAFNLPKSTCSAYKAAYEVPAELIKAHKSANDLNGKTALWWRATAQSSPGLEAALLAKLDEIINDRARRVKESEELLTSTEIKSILQKCADKFTSKKTESASQPTRKPIFYNGDNGVKVKRSRASNGNTKLELFGLDDSLVDEVVAEVCRKLKAK